jgi:hypothetical protein
MGTGNYLYEQLAFGAHPVSDEFQSQKSFQLSVKFLEVKANYRCGR